MLHGAGAALVLAGRCRAPMEAVTAARGSRVEIVTGRDRPGHKIRVNAIAAGYIETEMNTTFFASESGQALIRRVPQRRFGRMEDLAGPLLRLALGAVLTVDGWHSVAPL